MPKRIYIYNEKTKALHIDGFCPNSSPIGKRTFETEDDAVKYGWYVHSFLCFVQQKKR